MNELDISIETITQLGKLNDILGKALESGDEVMFDSYTQVTELLKALYNAIYFIKEWQEEHGYIEL